MRGRRVPMLRTAVEQDARAAVDHQLHHLVRVRVRARARARARLGSLRVEHELHHLARAVRVRVRARIRLRASEVSHLARAVLLVTHGGADREPEGA